MIYGHEPSRHSSSGNNLLFLQRLNRQNLIRSTALEQTSTPHRLLLTKHTEKESPPDPQLQPRQYALKMAHRRNAIPHSSRAVYPTSLPCAQPRLGIGYQPLVTITRLIIHRQCKNTCTSAPNVRFKSPWTWDGHRPQFVQGCADRPADM
jgi:hypothetical protein